MQRWPEHEALWHLHAVSLGMGGQAQAAVSLWERFLAQQPEHVEALANVTNAHLALKQPQQALACAQRALALDPQHRVALFNAAVAHVHLQQWDLAQVRLQTLLAQDAGHVGAWRLLTHVKRSQWDYGGVAEVVTQAEAAGVRPPDLLHERIGAVLYQPQGSAASLYDAIQAWATALPEVPACQHQERAAVQRLRVGLVSADLKHHPVGLLLQGLLVSQAARAVDWIGFHNSPTEDATTAELRAPCVAWHRIDQVDDEQVCALIQQERVDVLIDLSGHTVGHRLGVFRRRPAPLQLTWLGFHATTGLTAVDAIVVDPIAVPPDEQQWFSEPEVLSLPHTRYCWMPPSDAPAIAPLPALARGHVTFGSFQDLTKISDATLRCWAAIAEALPDARFRLQTRQWDAKNIAHQRFGQRCVEAGLPLQRVDWAGNMRWADYLAAYAAVDVVLDTFPFLNGTKTVQALWMGVPTLTLAQAGMIGRQGQSLMVNAGLGQWVASSEADYVAKAVACASAESLQALAAWRAQAREQLRQTPVFDFETFGRDWVHMVEAFARARGCLSSSPKTMAQDLSQALKQVLDIAQAGERERALLAGEALVQQWPQAALAHNMWAWVLDRFGEADRAAESWKRAVELAPRMADAWSNLGLYAKSRGQWAQAHAYLNKALEASPEHLNAHFNLGQTYAAQGLLDEAAACFEAMLRIDPQNAQAVNSLGVMAMRAYDYPTAVDKFAWVLQRSPGNLTAWSNLMFSLHYASDAQPERAHEHAKAWGDLVCSQTRRCETPAPSEPNKRLRIGLISGDLRDHSVTHFLLSLLHSEAAGEVDWYAYANNAIFDPVAQGIAQQAKAWHHIHNMNTERVCELIQRDGVDILVDLAGVTAGHRVDVLLRKPAPIQVSWLGYFATLGLPTVDAVLADPVCVPPGEERWFTEQVWHLPQTRLCMVPPAIAPEVVATPALSHGHFTFGSFQDLAKLNDAVLALWGRIAAQVPTARFRIQARFLDAEPRKRSNFEARLQAVGIALERVTLVTNTPFADYFAAHGDVDVILDSFPYPGGTTSVQAVWMGVPTVALSRPGMLARQGEQVLRAVRLDDWVAHDEDAYVALAVKWAQPQAWPALNSLRLGLRERARGSALFDGQRFGRDWLHVVRALWRHRCALAAPVPEGKSATQVALEEVLALRGQGQLAAAVYAARQAVAKWPSEPLAHNMLGSMLSEQGQSDAAQASWQHAIDLSPRFAHALFNLGMYWRQHGRAEQGVALLRRAVAAAPQNLRFQLNLADALQDQGDRAGAREHYEAAVAIDPEHVQANMNLGMWHARGMDFVAAHRHYREALRVDPTFVPAQFNLGFTAHYAYPNRVQAIFEQAKRWGEAMVAATPRCPVTAASDPHQRLRVGLVSADLRDHPVGYFLSPLLLSQAGAEVDWVAFSNQSVMTPLSHVLHQRCVAWHDISKCNDAQACDLIQREGIDVLIDLGGYTGGARLGIFARKPVAVQLTWLGYFSSTGLPTMDGVIADPVCVPAGEEQWFTERVWRLPETRLCMQVPSDTLPVAKTPALSKGHITFGSFQELPKITDAVLSVWAKVLKGVPSARLRVQSARLFGVEKQDFSAKLQALGVAPERVDLLGRVSFDDFLSAHAEVDVLLDTFSFPGGTTTAQALWMGVPTITLTQPGMLARQGEQLLRAVGLDDWVTHTPEAFVALAVHWAQPQQWSTLNALRMGLREQARRSALFDGERFGRDWVALLRRVWQAACGEVEVPAEAATATTPSLQVIDPQWRTRFREALRLRDQGQHQQAAELTQALLAEQPNRPELLNMWGVLMEELGRRDEWDAVMPRLEAHGGRQASCVLNVARWHFMAERFEAARDVLRAYLKHDKDHVEVMLMLAPLLRRLDDLKGARRMLSRIIELQPQHAEAYFKRGVLEESVGRWAQALADYEQALAVEPTHQNALINRMMVATRVDGYEVREAADAARRYATAWSQALGPWTPPLRAQGLGKRLRVGLVSGDLGVHPVGYFLQSLLLSEAAKQVDWVVYASADWDDAVNRAFRAVVPTWHLVSAWSTERLCQQVRDDGVDVLVDLSGYTAASRLDAFARKPAPLQVAWLGYFATTGLPTMDAVLADPVCLPDDEVDAFSEAVWRLPHTRLCMQPIAEAPEVAPAPVLRQGHITLGCIQDPYKISDAVLQAWSKILRAVPNARLVLQHSKLGEESATRRAFTQRMQAHGLSPKQVSFGMGRPFERYLAGFEQYDFLLDTWPYTGGTTTAQALWMGVPTVSLATPGMIGRQGQGLLTAAGLGDWVVHSVDDYVAKVVGWCDANRWDALAALRAGLRERLRSTPLFDGERFAQDWIATVHGVWHHACLSAGEAPDAMAWVHITRQAQRWQGLRRWQECARYLEPVWQRSECPMGLLQLYAVAQTELGEREQAMRAWQAVTERPDANLNAWGLAGQHFERLGEAGQSLRCLREVLRFNPDDLPALSRLAHAALAEEDWAQAVRLYRRWVDVQPQAVGAWHNMGLALKSLGDEAGALDAWHSALAVDPKGLPTLLSVGLLHKDAGRSDEAMDWFLRMLDVDAHHRDAHDALVSLLFSQAFDARRTFTQAAAAARRYGQRLCAIYPAMAPAKQATEPNKVLRIGLVSADLNDHPVAYFLMPLLKHMPRDDVHWVAYHTSARETPYTQALRTRCHTWRQVEDLDFDTLTQRIVDDRIDVLVDLAGFTAGHRLEVFARRPAPLQLSWLGYFASLGLPAMDAVLADPVSVPDSEAHGFSERVVRLPHTRLCLGMPPDAPAVSPLPASGRGHATIGCFQHPDKVNAQVLTLWAQVAAAAPGARWRFQHKTWEDEALVARMVARMQAVGFPSERVTWHGKTLRHAYLAAHAQVDFILDTFPYNGGTTTAEALVMGVPTLTLARPGMMGRQGESLLRAAGLDAWVTHDEAAYVRWASHWAQARHWPALARLRAGLRKQVLISPLMDGASFATDWLSVVRGLWQDQCANNT